MYEENKQRLEAALLEFIEATLKKPQNETDIETVPAMASVLIELWRD